MKSLILYPVILRVSPDHWTALFNVRLCGSVGVLSAEVSHLCPGRFLEVSVAGHSVGTLR